MSVVPTAALTHCSYKYINKYTTQPIQNKRITHLLSCVCENKTASAVVGGSSSSSNQDSRRNSSCSAGPTVYDASLRSTSPGEKVRFRNVTGMIVPDGIIGEKTPHPSTIPALSPLRADDGGWGGGNQTYAALQQKHALPFFQSAVNPVISGILDFTLKE